jgi:hypothetical protein
VVRSDAEIVEYYSDSSVGTSAIVWLQVLVVATIAYLWFVGVIRGRLGDREPRLFGTVFLGASILLAALMFVGTALLAAPAVLVAIGERDTRPRRRLARHAPARRWCSRCSHPASPPS